MIPGNALEVGRVFLKLGLTSFGGPIAHLGYFRREFVERRGWLDEEHFGQLMGLCQFLPGPASSQLGFSIGLLRAGWLGAVAAFLGFTLPSALLLYALAVSSSHFAWPLGQAAVHGLKLVSDPARALLAAAAAAALITVSGNPSMQLLAIAGGAVLGPWLCKRVTSKPSDKIALPFGRRTGSVLLLLFGVLLIIALLVAPTGSPLIQVGGAFYRAGALVFGGGHVVQPLLKQRPGRSGLDR